MDTYALIQLICAFTGAVGFALFFNVNARHVLLASLGGLVTWAIYWTLNQVMGQIFAPCLIASTFAAAWAEIMARIFRMPTTAFFIIAVIPLVPGRGLFYTMSDAVNANWSAFATDSATTLFFVAGIACGICLVTAFTQTVRYGRAKLRHQTQEHDETTGSD